MMLCSEKIRVNPAQRFRRRDVLVTTVVSASYSADKTFSSIFSFAQLPRGTQRRALVFASAALRFLEIRFPSTARLCIVCGIEVAAV
jgi:hypothetical protein